MIKETVKKLYNYSYLRRSNRKAGKFLKKFKSMGLTCTVADRSKADAYAVEVLGSKKFAPWLYTFSTLRGGFRHGWIPPTYYLLKIIPRINNQYRVLSDFKNLTRHIAVSDTVPDVAYMVNGKCYSLEFKPVAESDLKKTLFRKTDTILFKGNAGRGGRGIRIFSTDTFEEGAIRSLPDGCFQYFVEQHPFFTAISKHSVATMRIYTCRDPQDDVRYVGAYLRLGVGEKRHIDQTSQIRIPINRETDRMKTYGYLPDWSRSPEHPDSKFVFDGQELPEYGKAKQTCIDLHRQMPFFSIIGWDACIDRDGQVRILEANTKHPGVKFLEATVGPCFTEMGWTDG